MSWTDERVALLRKLWGEGKTAAEIAKELGGVTRNAVIGKAHRLKLSNRVSPIQQNQKPAKPAEKAAVAIAKAAVVKSVRTVEVSQAKNVKMADLGPKMCRWPQGDPRDADFTFCGGPSVPGLPYCEEHAKVAYQAPSRSRILDADELERSDDDAEDRKEALSA